MESPKNSGVAEYEEKLQKELSEKIKELEKMRENPDEQTLDKIKEQLKEIIQLREKIEKCHESIKNINNEKKKAIEELNKQTKEMKKLQKSVEKAYIKTQDGNFEIKKREHKDYNLDIDHKALKRLEGTTKSSFSSLAKDVILINGRHYSPKELTLSKERKRDFIRKIENFAKLEVIGTRKYNIKFVYTKKQREEMNELEIFPTGEKRK